VFRRIESAYYIQCYIGATIQHRVSGHVRTTITDQIDLFIEYYNNHRYHEALNNLIPADVYYGRRREVLAKRKNIKKQTMLQRRRS